VSLAAADNSRRVIFVARNLSGESMRAAQAIKQLDRLSLLGICEQQPDDHVDGPFSALVRVAAVHDSAQLISAARELAQKHGALERIVTATETLLEPVARANELLGLPGASVATVRRTLDKSCLKEALAKAGVATARDQLLTGNEDARRFVGRTGFPIVLKPLRGSGGLATWCIRNGEELELALELMRPAADNVVLAEEHVVGQELCIDTITIANEPRFHSICCYRPSILEALEDPRIQWTCVMPRDIDGDVYRVFIEQGLAAVRTLEVGDAMTHLEGFVLADGRVRFTDATLRPAGARISPMLAFAYDMDPYLAWARVAIDGCFDGPWERKYAVGTIFMRGIGRGNVAQVEGLEVVKREIGELLVDGRVPLVGAPGSMTYTGDGYLTIRHPTTRVVEEALDLIARTVCITYTASESVMAPAGMKENWSERLTYFDKQLNKPAWDNDAPAAIVSS
jgi:hypothetical protein